MTFIKVVAGDTSDPGAWTFNVEGGPQDIAHNSQVTLATGTYTVTEAGPDGYLLTAASGLCSLDNDGAVVLVVDGSGGTCAVTNTLETTPPGTPTAEPTPGTPTVPPAATPTRTPPPTEPTATATATAPATATATAPAQTPLPPATGSGASGQGATGSLLAVVAGAIFAIIAVAGSLAAHRRHGGGGWRVEREE